MIKHWATLATLSFLFWTPLAHAEVGVTDTEIVIGAHTTESGTLASSAPFATSQSAYYSMVNDEGGVFGRKIKFIRKDTQSLAPKNVEAIRSLVENEKVFATVGCAGNAHTAVYKYLGEKGVPDFYFSDFAKVYKNKSLKNSFPMYYTTYDEAASTAKYIVTKKNVKKICVLATKDTAGQEFLEGVLDSVKNLKSQGTKVELGPTPSVERLANQADTEIMSFKQAKCDGVMTSALTPLAPNVINYATSQNYKPQWVVTLFNANAKFTDLLTEGVAEGIISTTNIARDKSSVVDQKSWDKYEALMKKNHIPISGLSMAGYTVGEMFTETLRRAGKNLTRQSVAKAALTYKDYWCSLCVGPFNASEENHTLASSPWLIVNKDKNWVLAK